MAKRTSRALFRDRICAVIAAPTAKQMIDQASAALRTCGTVEVRLDWLLTDRERILACMAIQKRQLGPFVIATCRRIASGGKYAADRHAELAHLAHASAVRCAACDIGIESVREFSPDHRNFAMGLLRPSWIIVSLHDFKRTPGDLEELPKQALPSGLHVAKIATQCNSIRDSLRVLALAKGRRQPRRVIAVPMGEMGLPARVLALRHGSALAYASVGEKTAPGQLTLDEMKNLYRADKLNRRSRVYGVIGNPVEHSLSPVLHNTGFIARRMNDVYLPFLVRELPDFLAAIKPLGIAGFSVTLPHKEKIIRHLDDCDPLAAAIGAVNTVVVRGGGKLYGMNTDYVGVLRAIERRMPLPGSRVLIYGAGGAARAVAFALAQAGAIVCVCARRMKQAERLAHGAGGEAVARPRLRREFFDAIVNATPVGMHPRESQSPLTAAELNCRLVFDLIYRPLQTKLLRLAARRGIETVSGVEMFIAQGTAQWEIWTGLRAPEKQMRAAVMKKLSNE